MKKLFGRDFAAELEKTRADLTAGRHRLEELQHDRKTALGEATVPMADLRKLDRYVDEAKGTIALLEDRMSRLRVLRRQDELSKREAARDAAIANIIAPKLVEAGKLAERLEGSLAALADDYQALTAVARDLGMSWPASVPKPLYWDGVFAVSAVRSRITSAMRYASNGSVGRLVEFANMHCEETISASVRRQCEASLAELKAVEIVLPPEPDDADLSEPVKAEHLRGVAALATSGVA